MQHEAPRRITEGVKHGIEWGRLKINHVVEYTARGVIGQPFG
jgi:hypothetical protein